MRINPKILIFRLILGLVGGWVLTRFFLVTDRPFVGQDWLTVLVLAVLIVVAATASEAWRRRK